MTWTAPKTWAVGETVTAANVNLHLRDNMKATVHAFTDLTIMQSGTFTVTFASGVATGTITFPTTFSTVPIVVVSCAAITGNTSAVINNNGTSASTASWRAQQQATATTYAGGVSGYYIAVGT